MHHINILTENLRYITFYARLFNHDIGATPLIYDWNVLDHAVIIQ